MITFQGAITREGNVQGKRQNGLDIGIGAMAAPVTPVFSNCAIVLIDALVLIRIVKKKIYIYISARADRAWAYRMASGHLELSEMTVYIYCCRTIMPDLFWHRWRRHA